MKYRNYLIAVFAIVVSLNMQAAKIITDAKGHPLKVFVHDIPPGYVLPKGAKIVERPNNVAKPRADSKPVVAKPAPAKTVVPPEVQARRDAMKAQLEAARHARPDPRAVRDAQMAELKAKQAAQAAKHAERQAKIKADIEKSKADFKAKQAAAKAANNGNAGGNKPANPNKPK